MPHSTDLWCFSKKDNNSKIKAFSLFLGAITICLNKRTLGTAEAPDLVPHKCNFTSHKYTNRYCTQYVDQNAECDGDDNAAATLLLHLCLS